MILKFFLRKISVFFLLGSIFATPVQACSGAAAEGVTFSDRCEQMAESVRQICRFKATKPLSVNAQMTLLLNIWIDVFISHGHEPPPVFASLPLDSWKTSLNNLGQEIGAFSRNTGEATESVLLSLDLLGQPPMVFSCHELLHSWEVGLASASNIGKVLPTNWFDTAVPGAVLRLGDFLGRYPHLKSRFIHQYKTHRHHWKRLQKNGLVNRENVAILWRAIRQDFKSWRLLFFY